MFRILLYLLALVLAAAIITFVASMSGHFEGRVFGYEIYWPVGVVVGLILTLILVVIGLTLFACNLATMPERIRRKRHEMARSKGMIALTRGLEAVAAGDADDAQRHARAARRQLDEPALTRLLTAQAAQIAGDEPTAAEAFTAMLEAPETEFLGLRGLYQQAIDRHDHEAARGFAERAFRLRPNADWAFNSVYRLNIERGAWGTARETLNQAAKAGYIRDDKSRREEAVLWTADAYDAHSSGDNQTALKETESALRLAPAFPPAVALAARLQHTNGKTDKAFRTLESAWKIEPHLSLTALARDIAEDLPKEARQQKFEKLSNSNPDHRESRLLLISEHLDNKEWGQAQSLLEPLLEEQADTRTSKMMAQVMAGLYGEEQAKPWLDRAAAFPTNPEPGAGGSFNFDVAGWRRILDEYGQHARLTPPPVESTVVAMSREDILMLTAPPSPLPEKEPVEEKQEEPVAEKAGTTPLVTDGKTEEASPEEETIVEAPRPDWAPDEVEDAKS